MATTITRTTWTDDSGTPSNPAGDGTTLNNDRLQDIYDAVDALLTSALLVGGTIGSEGFGAHTFSAGGTGVNRLIVRNTTAGTGNYAAFDLGNDAATVAGRLYLTSSTYTPSGWVLADGLHLENSRVGGISIATTNASATIRAYTNSIERLRILAGGIVSCLAGGASPDGNYGRAIEAVVPASNYG